MTMNAIEKLLDAVKKIVANYKKTDYCLYYEIEGDPCVHMVGFGNEFMVIATLMQKMVREGYKEELTAVVNSILYKEGEDDD